MSGQFRAYFLYLGELMLALGQCFYFYSRLPERMVTHFGPSGEPNGWMEKNEFFQFYAVILLGTIGLMVGIGWLMSKIPTDLINLPNREYWLAPERRMETLVSLQNQMNYLGVATGALVIAMMQLTFQANLTAGSAISNLVFVILGAYMVFTIVWTIGLLVRFSAPK